MIRPVEKVPEEVTPDDGLELTPRRRQQIANRAAWSSTQRAAAFLGSVVRNHRHHDASYNLDHKLTGDDNLLVFYCRTCDVTCSVVAIVRTRGGER